MTISIFCFFIIVLQTLVSAEMSPEMVNVLVTSPNSPISTSSSVKGSFQCTKNSDESYAVCASYSNIAVKYNLQPFSFATKGADQGKNLWSCDLYETSSQTTSRAVCAKGNAGTNGVVYFHSVSDMMSVTNVTIGASGNNPHVIVDTPNQVAYASNYKGPPAIYKITNIGSSTPIVVGTLSSFGSGDYNPAAMLTIDGFLYVHFATDPARLARINIATFTWNRTVTFVGGESNGDYDNLANDDNYIYDLTNNGILVRCTYKNNNFSRFDSLNTGFSMTYSLGISPDSSFLLLTASYSGIIVVNTSSFSVESRELLPNPTSAGYVYPFGRPIILSKNNNTNAYPVCAFSGTQDHLYTFNISQIPFRDIYPTIDPLPSSPISTSSGVQGSLQCTKNSDESFAVCASNSNIAIKYNLHPFSFAAKGPNQGKNMWSCDLYETSSQSTSCAVCVKNGSPNGVVYFHRVSDMINVTNVTIGICGTSPHVIVDAPNQVAYISNFYNPPAIHKITNIGSSTPLVAATLSSFGSGDNYPAAMLIIDECLYVHLSTTPARLARVNISTFMRRQTVFFASGENYGWYDNLANDDNFIYDLVHGGVVVRCTYKNNSLVRFDSLNAGLTNTYSLAISPDLKTLFVAGQDHSVLQLINISSFSMIGKDAMVPGAFGRPIVTSSRYVYAFSQNNDNVFVFQYANLGNENKTFDNITHSPSISSVQTLTSSLVPQLAPTSSHSLMHSTPSLSLIEAASSMSEMKSVSPRQPATIVAITGFETRTLTQGNRRQQHKKSQTLSLEADAKIPFIQKISQSVASALVASDATQAIAVVSVAVFGSISSSPVLGFNVGRQQAMTNFAKKSLEGDCRGLLPSTTVNDIHEKHISNPLGLGDSPTQMSIGGKEKLMSYYVGAVVGDFILTFGLVLLSQGIGMGVMNYFEKRKKNNSAFGKMVRDRMGNKNKNKESIFEMMRRVFATSYVSLTLFFCLSFLLTPILSSSLIVLVAAMNDPKLKDHEVGVGLKILCVILAVVFGAVAVYFVVWSVFVRKQRKEKYRMLKQEKEPGFVAKLFKAEGEWCYPNPTSKSQQNLSNLMKSSRNNNKNYQRKFLLSYHNFLIAEPTFESYRDTIWFCSVEIISAILLAFPPFFAQFSSSAKGSCLVQGIMLLLILVVYTILLIWKNPFKLRILRIMNPVLAVQQLAIVLISLIIVAIRSSNDDDGESPSWLWKIIIMPLAFQGVMSFMMIGAAFFPFVMFLRKLKGRMSRNDDRAENSGSANNKAMCSRVTSSPRTATSRRHNEDATDVELLPRRRSEIHKTSSEHERERHHRTYDSRHRDTNNPSRSNRDYREKLRSNEHRTRSHHNSERNEIDHLPSAIAENSDKHNNEKRNRSNNSEIRGRNNSDERETRRSSRNNNNEQRERDRCAQTLNISSSLLSPRRENQSHSREQSKDNRRKQ